MVSIIWRLACTVSVGRILLPLTYPRHLSMHWLARLFAVDLETALAARATTRIHVLGALRFTRKKTSDISKAT